MPTLTSVKEKTALDSFNRQRQSRKVKTDWLRLIALLKLQWWRIGNDIAAVGVMIEKCRAKLATLEPEDLRRETILEYEANLDTYRDLLQIRYKRIRTVMFRWQLENLTDEQSAWWRVMQPIPVMIHIPKHLHYWLGTTEKSPVGYERTSSAKLDSQGRLLWRIRPEYFSLNKNWPQEILQHEFSYMATADVEAEIERQFDDLPL